MTTTPQAALLSDAAKLADELDHEASKRACNVAMMPASLPVDAAKELRRLDALVAHLTADRDDTANELALRTKHNLALTNERDQLLAKLQATQEPVQAGELPDEREAFEKWASDNGEFPRAVARSGDVYHLMATQTYWLAWQARAALSARKPLTPLTPDQIEAEFDKRNAELERVGHGTDVPSDLWDFSIGAHFGIQEFCRINGIGLEVKP